MTVTVPEPTATTGGPSAATAAAVTALAVASAHQATQNALTDATLAAVLEVWAAMDRTSWFDSWWRQRAGQRVYTLIALAQEGVANEARPYVEAVLNILGTPVEIPQIVPTTFAGIASDGTDLEALLALAPVISYARTQRGESPEAASAAGANFLRQAVTTQIQDAGRAADQVAISVAVPIQRGAPPSMAPTTYGLTAAGRERFRARGKKSTYNFDAQVGYVRVLSPPSCPRCLILAGKFYRWNEGFLRHPMCDCRHLPVVVAAHDTLVVDPKKYFDSLSEPEQDALFGRANAAAIRAGSDIYDVVNAAASGRTWVADNGRRYTKSAGQPRRRTRRTAVGPVLRPTPWQIYRDARGNRDEAARLLHEFGYIRG